MKNLGYILLAAILTISCKGDTRFDFINDIDNAPIIRINGFEDVEVMDSLKTSIKTGSDFYQVKADISDKEESLAVIRYKITGGTGMEMVYNGTVVTEIDVAGMNEVVFDFRITEEVTESVTILITLIDTAKKTATISLTLVVFNNIPPVAILPIQPVKIGLNNSQEYEFDAGDSFDGDKRQGGGIQLYLWDVNGQTFFTESASFRQGFDLGGYDISLTVYDNDGEPSETVSKIYQIN